MTAEITARITANASDFTASINAVYADVDAKAKANAAELQNTYSQTYRQLTGVAKREFAQTFAEIKKLADVSAANGPTNGVFGFDAGAARAAANAARDRAAALQQFVDRAEAARNAGELLTAQERQLVVASQAALTEAVGEANALRAKADALEKVTGATAQNIAAQGRYRVSAGQMQAGAQQLSFQISDVAQQFAVGTNPMVIFAQQGSQVVQAISMMTDSTDGLLGFLGGPWGAVLTGAAVLLSTFAFNSEDAAEKTDLLNDKINAQKLSMDDLAKSIDTAIDNLERQNRSARENAELARTNAVAARDEEVSRLQVAKAILQQSVAQKALFVLQASGGNFAAVFTNYQLYEKMLESQIGKINESILNAYKLIGLTENNVTKEINKEAEARKRAAEAAEREAKAKAKNAEALAKENAQRARMTPFVSPLDMGAPGVRVSGQVGNRKHPIHGDMRFHAGQDIAAPAGTPVLATAEGTVIHVGKAGGYGNVIVIDHGNKISTKFAHLLDKGDVAPGDRVSPGQMIGRVGSTGDSTGNHLHYEVRSGDPYKGKVLDPRKGKFAIDPEGADAGAAANAEDQAAKAAERRAESIAKINADLDNQGRQLRENARIEELRRQGLDAQADKEQQLYELHSRYSALIANDPNLTAEDRKQAEMKLAVLEAQTAALIDQKNAADATKAANDNAKRLGDDINRDIAEERERQRLDALRAAGLDQQAEKEYAIWQYRSRYHDLLTGEPEIAAKLLGITAEQVIAERERLKQSEELIAKGVADNQARENISRLADFYERAFSSGGKSIWSDFKAQGRRVLANLLAQWTAGLINGSSQGLGSLLSGIGGGGSGGLGAGVLPAGAGSLGAISAAIQLNQMVGKLFGSDQIKNGGLLTALFGPVGLAFGSAKRGSATLGFANGSLGIGSTRGNSRSRIESASNGVNSLADQLESIAEQLGGSITGAGSVSIGIRKKRYVVDTTGKGRTKGAGVLSFKDEKEAVMAALKDALGDGVVSGISAASQKILSSGQDLQKALQKALLIEAIPKALKARTDPLGAKLDELYEKWAKTAAALKEGAATVEQIADARKLYELERTDLLAAANDNLKDFINSLNFGSSSTYSLLDQRVSARAEVEPYLAMIRSGNFAGVDQDRYLAGANELLAIQRQIGGSGPEWFATVDEFRNATQRLADGLSASSTANDRRDPFAELTATAAQSTAANTLATAEILSQHTAMLASINEQLASLGSASGGGGFIGSDRAFLGRAA